MKIDHNIIPTISKDEDRSQRPVNTSITRNHYNVNANRIPMVIATKPTT